MLNTLTSNPNVWVSFSVVVMAKASFMVADLLPLVSFCEDTTFGPTALVATSADSSGNPTLSTTVLFTGRAEDETNR